MRHRQMGAQHEGSQEVSQRQARTLQAADLLGGREVTFVPADPPRRSVFAVFDTRAAQRGSLAGAEHGLADLPDLLDVVLPSGNGVRRHRVPARFVPVADCIVALRDAGIAAARPDLDGRVSGDASPAPAAAASPALAPGADAAASAGAAVRPALAPGADAAASAGAAARPALAPGAAARPGAAPALAPVASADAGFDEEVDLDTADDLRAGPEISASVLAWSAAVTTGLVVLARGRLYPAVSHAGYDIWRAGPLDPADHRLLGALAEAMPPAAYATVHDSRSPMRVPSPDRLVMAAWDALADTLPRTAAAPVVTGTSLFSVAEPQAAEHLRSWLVDAAQGLGGGALVALRVELDPEMPPPTPDEDFDDEDFDDEADDDEVRADHDSLEIEDFTYDEGSSGGARAPGGRAGGEPSGTYDEGSSGGARAPGVRAGGEPSGVREAAGGSFGTGSTATYLPAGTLEAAGAGRLPAIEGAPAGPGFAAAGAGTGPVDAPAGPGFAAAGAGAGAGFAAAGAGTDHPAIAGRAVLELTSRVEPSLVVDAADLFAGPAAVLARFGTDTETDLLLALRRGARVWPPLQDLLRERAPTAVTLDEERLGDLLGEVPAELAAAGIEVRWPTDLITDGLALRAVIVEQPGKVTEAGFSLDELVEFRWEATLGGDALSAEEIDQLAEAKRGLVRMRGRWVTVDPRLLDELRRRRARRLTAAEALGALLAGTVDVDGEPVAVVAPGRLGQLAETLRRASGADAEQIEPPDGLCAELRPYQRRGVSWLWAMASTGIGGCLADDMGLGKTLQVIALHLHRRAAGSGPTLVVCPTTLLTNWEREVHRFAPDVAVRRYHGPGRSLADLDPGELVVTSYGVARSSTDDLAGAGFSLVVADEAQHAKNPASATARALRSIPAQARVALTGTPVENRLSELWAILDWTTPGLLGPLERFLHTVAVPVERYRDPIVTERLARTVRPFLMRRRKTDPGIAPDLPPRTVSDVPVPLTAEQVTLYEAEVREAMAKIRAKAGFERQGLVLRLLTVLKQICNHPAQYLHQPGPVPGRSGKFAALEELLGVIVAEGESTLVFSQFVECLTLIDTRLGELGVPTLCLHGQVPARRRAAMVDAFQGGEVPVFLISLKSGGVGLNLTRATHVVHVDRWWNPAVEDQATDRAHRIGQDHPVQVHRLVAEGTLEDRIAEVIEAKRGLAESVVGSGEAWVSSLSDDDLAALVQLGRP